MELTYHAATHVGRLRDNNEDNYGINGDKHLYLVADGMGGHEGGEIASGITVETFQEFFQAEDKLERLAKIFEERTDEHGEIINEKNLILFLMRRALEEANSNVYRYSQEHSKLANMGTTAVMAAFEDNRIYAANVGDSRLYRFRNGKLFQMTEDHSLANEYLKRNLITKDELDGFPYKNIIVRALGLHDRIVIDTYRGKTYPGDQYILCTDGLTDMVEHADMKRIMHDSTDPEDACNRLIEAALFEGGLDNVTLAVIRVD